MAKILLGTLAFLILAFIIIAVYCAITVTGRSDAQTDEQNIKGADEELFFKKQICTKCKTGKYTYELDPTSEVCPYIGYWKRNKCHFYKPLDKASKSGLFKRNKNESL